MGLGHRRRDSQERAAANETWPWRAPGSMCHRMALSLGRASRLAAAAALGICLLVLPKAEAKTAHSSPYTYEQTYGTALRLLKVDLGLTITEQDPTWGYLLFEYSSRESGDKKSRGSFEFVRGRDGVQVWLQLASMPSYHERLIVDKLARKLVDEHGTPPPRPKEEDKPKKGKGDDGSHGGDQDRAEPDDKSKPAPPPQPPPPERAKAR
jgi:hypothetical protein